ncbi:class I tRNA ligase family protein, partial [Escherichia coli]|nr:class I tRNA ligase family protein [Escherichia coli]EJO9114779.1 class I tRNA ligase family protein [Escherichia coli]
VPDSWSFVSDFSFDNVKVVSPYHKKLVSLYHADFVEQSGTGFVHVAPSFGLDDFHLGEAHNLETKSYVNEYGKYNTDEFPELMGLDLKKATSFVLEKLNEEGLVYHHTMFNHEYPHCWRHKTPLFSKTSKEWFMDLSNVKDEAQQAADKVEFYPENGKTRLKSMLEGRSSWCVSRNRLWGVPLPKDNTVEAMAEYKSWMNEVEVNGLSALYEDPTFKPQTLDVWFDSGMTHTTVVKEEFGFTQSDLYLEGSDQHRGWFQSSLLTSLALNGSAPYKQVLTHGFVVDEKGVKLSKSVGNYVSMEDLLKEYSPDTLRLWALGQDYSKELTYSKATLNNALERYKKFRNTLRFMLQNLDDFDVSSFELNMDQLD